jgi:hypothetical protein
MLEKMKTHISRSITLARKSYRLWDNVEKFGAARQATDGNIIQRMRIVCGLHKATNTHSEYVIIIIAFPIQKLLQELTPILLSAYITCLVKFLFRLKMA